MDDLLTLPIIKKLDDSPFIDEVGKAILSLKDNKAAHLTTSLLRPFSMVCVLYIGGCIILCLTVCTPSVSHSNEKMPTLSLCTSRTVTKQNVATVVASPFSL